MEEKESTPHYVVDAYVFSKGITTLEKDDESLDELLEDKNRPSDEVFQELLPLHGLILASQEGTKLGHHDEGIEVPRRNHPKAPKLKRSNISNAPQRSASKIDVQYFKEIGSESICDKSFNFKEIDCGFFSRVKIAEMNGVKVAVKFINQGFKKLSRGQSLYNEANNVSQLDHPNIVKCLGARTQGSDDENCILFEFIENGCLESFLSKNTLTQADIEKVILDVALGMKYIVDQQILHRDIQPANILIQKQINGEITAKIADFGCSTDLKRGGDRFIKVGKIDYMSPEVLSGEVENEKSEVYSFGKTFDEIYNHCDLDSGKMKDLLTACCNTNPNNRPTFEQILQKYLKFDDKNYNLTWKL